jgi:hypothetical protein
MLVDYNFYENEYDGEKIEGATEFNSLSKQAEKDVYSFIDYAMDDLSKLDERRLKLVKKAICMQAEYLDVHGVNHRLDSSGGGFNIGSYSKNANDSKTKDDQYHPDLKMVLFRTGLLYKGVSVW